ncbi:YciK family oxidoreductase [Woeseia oceani]|uniref:YciK family oxidoreductase n=1 Tax=Woeseia oceani TaxID=1548547 RepID=A0A193LL56_9GAMM|nr:YciK family oxidoreductase [Woeseia oceani]ANO53144.1 YciK family oxidoreductase [Woeseia oceani]
MDHKNYDAPTGLLRDKVILITGASDGIGRALAIETARLGARVILHGRNAAKLEKVYDAIEAIEGSERPSIAVMDLATADGTSYSTLAESLLEEFGRLDGLVHNAGILGNRQPIEQYDAGEWQKVLHVNLTAAFALTQVLLPLLHQAEQPSVIFTSSGVGRVGKPFWGAYSVSKFGTEALSQILAAEQEHTGMRVNCINPGAVRTGMRLAAYPAEDRDALKTPEQVLASYLYLLGPDSKEITGQSLDAQ